MFTCTECSTQYLKWQGKCSSCESWNTLSEQQKEKKTTSKIGIASAPIPISKISSKGPEKILSGIGEWDDVLGGGITQGSMIILTGDPGVGKSTLIMQVAHQVATKNKVIYFSSEESLQQLRNKINHLGLDDTKILFSDEYNVQNIIQTLKQEKPILAIIDSLQNCRLDQSVSQNFSTVNALKETAHELMILAKQENIAMLMTGHITKEGVLAGPKLLEHLVDAVFYLQNDQDSHKKILSSVKNRFGPIDEIGFFEMGDRGFSEVKDVNKSVMEESCQKNSLGSTLYLTFKGSRCLLSEFQALCVKNYGNIPQRIISGIDPKKVLIIAALLEKYLKIELGNQDIFFKIKGGIKINENHSDLAIALTLISSYLKTSLPTKILAVGEINLNGRISTPASGLEKILKNSKRLGIERVITGGTSVKDNENLILPVTHIYQLLSLFEKNQENQSQNPSAQNQ